VAALKGASIQINNLWRLVSNSGVLSRCERRPTEEEAILVALTGELNKAVLEAKKSLKSGLDEAQAVLAELPGQRQAVAARTTSVPSGRKALGAHA
jgi:hypothetical protein